MALGLLESSRFLVMMRISVSFTLLLYFTSSTLLPLLYVLYFTSSTLLPLISLF
jgi:hypothetical protein